MCEQLREIGRNVINAAQKIYFKCFVMIWKVYFALKYWLEKK